MKLQNLTPACGDITAMDNMRLMIKALANKPKPKKRKRKTINPPLNVEQIKESA